MLYPSPHRYSAAELALIHERANAGRQSPHWQFAPLTPLQQRGVALQQDSMRRRTSVVGALAGALVLSACATAPAPRPAEAPARIQAACPSPLVLPAMTDDAQWRAIYTQCREAALAPPPVRRFGGGQP